jgi:hypothetical protein
MSCVTQRTMSCHRQRVAAFAPHSINNLKRMVIHAIAWKPLQTAVVETRHAAIEDRRGWLAALDRS